MDGTAANKISPVMEGLLGAMKDAVTSLEAYGEDLADKMCARTFADRVFFTNSGTEATQLATTQAAHFFTLVLPKAEAWSEAHEGADAPKWLMKLWKAEAAGTVGAWGLYLAQHLAAHGRTGCRVPDRPHSLLHGHQV